MQWKHAEPELRKTEYEDCLYVLYIVQYSTVGLRDSQ